MSKKKNIDKKALYDEMVISMHYGKPTDKLVKYFEQISAGVISMFSYRINEDRNDVIAKCVMEANSRFYKYDFNRENPFSWLTGVVKNVGFDEFKDINKHSSISLDAIIDGSINEKE